MNCPRHPNKRVVATCKECGAEYCIECVRETDQTTLCPECFRRKMSEVARQYEKKEERSEAAAPQRPQVEAEDAAALAAVKEGEPEERKAPKPARKAAAGAAVGAGLLGRRRKKGRRKRPEAVRESPAGPAGDFLSQGPDDDFSEVTGGKARKSRLGRMTGTAAAAEAEEVETPRVEEAEAARRTAKRVTAKPQEREETSAAETTAISEDYLLQDVVSTLLKPEAGAAESAALEAEPAEVEELVPAGPTPAKAGKKKPARAPAKAKVKKEKDPERWAFLAQPRSSEYTMLGRAWWRSTIFIAIVLLAGAVIWAVVNVYLIPGDKEFGIFALFIGALIGIAFWWKAGRKHSTKLAVQASLTTFFALFIGEFLLWFLTIMRFSAFRTIFFDLISFKFIWENGAEIMRNVMEAMFPTSFIWLLLLPTAIAFIIGFGLPPIPEIFSQFWHALRGDVTEEKEASHGLEG